MSEQNDALIKLLTSYESPLLECGGQPVISAYDFSKLAGEVVTENPALVLHTVLDVLELQTKRFVACGGNVNGKYAVIRKNPKNGWAFLVDLLTE